MRARRRGVDGDDARVRVRRAQEGDGRLRRPSATLSTKRPRPRSSAPSSMRCTARPLPKRADGVEASASRSMRVASGLQRRPHLLVALRGPDARVAVRGRLVEGARDVERHAVLVDELLAVASVAARRGCRRRRASGRGPAATPCLTLANSSRDEGARRGDAVAAHRRVGERGAAAGHDRHGAERLDACRASSASR